MRRRLAVALAVAALLAACAAGAQTLTPDEAEEVPGAADLKSLAAERARAAAGAQARRAGAEVVQSGPVDPKTYRNVRAYDRVVPTGQDWKKVMEKDLVAIW